MPGTRNTVTVFPTSLGWIGMVGAGKVLKQLAFGYPSAESCVRALDPALIENAKRGSWNAPLVRQLKAYAQGTMVDFNDVPIELGQLGKFQRRVIDVCRRIPYGKTLSYGQLAAKAGSPGAARAVGNCMAANRFPLVIPCHRVVPTGSGLGGFSAPGGVVTKKRLLAMESARLVATSGHELG